MRALVYMLALVLMLASCERYEDVELNVPHDDKVVATCFLNPDESNVVVWVQKTYPIFGSETPLDAHWLTDATVSLQTSSGNLVLAYDSMSRSYYADVSSTPLEKGKTYKVIVEHALENISGTTTIPEETEVKLDLVFDTSYSTYQGKTYRAKFGCTNTGNKEAYMMLVPGILLDDSSVYPMYYSGSNRVQIIKPGQRLEQTFTTPAAGIEVSKVMVMCYTTDEFYAKYFNKNNTFDYASLGVPYAEASVTYSNMSNKIGIVGSYFGFYSEVFNLK